MRVRIPSTIRVSVDALCRDGAGLISRDRHTKRFETRQDLNIADTSILSV